MTVNEPEVVEITAQETHPLRLAVLRFDTPTNNVDFAEDALPGTTHLALRLDGELIATSSWVRSEYRGAPAVQLRGMATARHLQGIGLGATLLEAGCARFAAEGVDVVWARARDAALRFYGRHGFVVEGDGFIDETTQLPHHVVVRALH